MTLYDFLLFLACYSMNNARRYMPCDPIQGRGEGHRASEVPTIALFQVYLSHLQWELANDH